MCSKQVAWAAQLPVDMYDIIDGGLRLCSYAPWMHALHPGAVCLNLVICLEVMPDYHM